MDTLRLLSRHNNYFAVIIRLSSMYVLSWLYKTTDLELA